MSDFNLEHFYQYCNQLRIDTKEVGQVYLGRHLMGSQKYFFEGVAKALEEGVREIVVLKARQLGISTACLALDLYWLGKYNAITGALITQDEPSREKFRTTLEMYYQSLPKTLKRPVKGGGFGNRNQLVFMNRSRLEYKVAGTKTKSSGTLGRSSALAFMHATEVAFWGNVEDIDSLQAVLAQQNPNRLYIWESTANSFNHYWDQWESAKEAVTQRAIFIGWWTNEFYRAARHTDVYLKYWGGAGVRTRDERTMCKEVKTLYGYEIDAEQLAWYRWYKIEKCDDNELTMWQEMPGTEYQAFVSTGTQFFTSQAIGDAYRSLHKQGAPRCCRFQIGARFADTTIIVTPPKSAQLRIWELPVDGAFYVLGADPAYGSSETADSFCLSVWRCYADQIDQVAEFRTPDFGTDAFAWAMVYLAGWYRPCTWNLEINGPGQVVLAALQALSRERTFGDVAARPMLQDALKQVSTYLFTRYDTLYRQPSGIHTYSSFQYKERYLGLFKDYFQRNMATVRSRELLNEMKMMKRQDGGTPEASGREKDDRVIAAALAIVAWHDQVKTKLMISNITAQRSKDKVITRVPDHVANRVVADLFRKIGYTNEEKPRIPGVTAGRLRG